MPTTPQIVLIVALALTSIMGIGCADGSKIVFQKIDRNGKSDISVMNADGSNQTRLTDTGSDETPSWSPDGSKIAFHSSQSGSGFNNFDIYVMNADGTNHTLLTDNFWNDTYPDWGQ
mgnify:CR=1 FL=1